VTPGKFATPPVTTDPKTGQQVLTGGDALPWAIDTLSLGGDIRDRLIRLQNWVRTVYIGEPAAPIDPQEKREKEKPAATRRRLFGIF
jgi:hypothetical protein